MLLVPYAAPGVHVCPGRVWSQGLQYTVHLINDPFVGPGGFTPSSPRKINLNLQPQALNLNLNSNTNAPSPNRAICMEHLNFGHRYERHGEESHEGLRSLDSMVRSAGFSKAFWGVQGLGFRGGGGLRASGFGAIAVFHKILQRPGKGAPKLSRIPL